MTRAILQKIPPRTAGNATALIGLVAAVAAGFLIANPPLSIPAAVLLVAATILICVGAIWRLKRTWDDPWPPYTPPDRRKLLRRFRILFIFSCVFMPVVLAFGVYAAIVGMWWYAAYSVFLAAMSVFNMRTFSRYLRFIQAQAGRTGD
jgi:hypothetical protein